MSSSQPTVIEIPIELVASSSAPGLSRTDTARIYFDGTNLLSSLAAGAYAAFAGGGGGTPSGPAGGDLTGTYPNPTLAAFGPGATGPIGDATHVPIITIDVKGRVSALTSASILAQTANIADSAVTLAKLANIADQTILGNNTGGAAAPVALTAAQVQTILALVIGTNVQAWSAVLDALTTVMSSTATAAAQRTALGLGTAAVQNVAAFLQPANNLSDVTTAATARANIGSNGYDLGFFVSGKPTASQIVCVFTATRALSFPASLTGSAGKAYTAATAQADFDVQKNGVSVGTVRWAGAGTVPSFIAGSPIALAAGDVLKIVAPGSQDATLADLGATLLGTF